MALFQVSVLKNYLKLQDDQVVDKAYKKFTSYFQHPEIQENIRKSKEEQFQATFLNELFVKILGYTLNPNPSYNLSTEFKNESNNRKADGAILKDGNAIGVIELKGTNTKHLEGIRQQAFDYKANQKHCVYVITSNFEKLRFYIQDATEFLEFDLFELNRDDFGLLWLCLSKENILNGLPLKIKEASLGEEEEITKEFYKDYSLFKRELFRDLVQRNVERLKDRPPGYESDAHVSETEAEKEVKLNLFKKSQKLIDRFLFIFFAEDRGLLPPNAVVNILLEWNQLKDLDAEIPLYERFKQYFGYLNHGRSATDTRPEIYAYNGGLFKPDELLDGLEIDDHLLYKHTSKLAKYDFESQVDVNILGHIFENSLNEIESVSAEIEGAEFDKQKSKRKKDGVFYTPKYITKYIVENTIGKLCEEKKSKLGFREEEYFRGRKRRQKDTLEGLLKILNEYRDWLLQITICDPACGSGAFLNQALDFLIREHRYIDEMKAKLLGGSIILSDIENTILEKNIYGVDINEESVEIAKLSLWLRTAQPSRKLSDLSGNIKCGNSLIDDAAIAHNKAFKWEEEFPEVFEKSGFDVVIGNPPYVRQELIHINDKEWLAKNYQVGNGTADLYVYFYELAFAILANSGYLGFITPNKFYKTRYGRELRKDLKKRRILELVDFFELRVFQDASTDSQIAIVQNLSANHTFNYLPIKNIASFISKSQAPIQVEKSLLTEEAFIFLDVQQNSLIKKLKVNTMTLQEYTEDGIEYGIKTGYNEAFIIDKEKAISFLSQNKNGSLILKPYLRPTSIKNWHVEYGGEYLIATVPSRKFNIEEFPLIKDHFLNYGKERLNQSGGKNSRKKTSNNWFETSDSVNYIDKFDGEKIIYIRTAVQHQFYYDTNGYYVNDSCYIISPADKFLACFLNSKVFNYYKKVFFVAYGNADSGGRVKLDHNKMVNVPVPILSKKEKEPFNDKLDYQKDVSDSFYKVISTLNKYILTKFNLTSLTRKLKSWHELEFGEFIKELNKAIKASNKVRAKEGFSPVPELTKKDEFEWMELFEENKQKAMELQREIEKTGKVIDKMVYELYGLTKEEIGIVEGSV